MICFYKIGLLHWFFHRPLNKYRDYSINLLINIGNMLSGNSVRVTFAAKAEKRVILKKKNYSKLINFKKMKGVYP